MATEESVPKGSLFKPAEVCTIAGLQPFVLRTWEAEFPSLARLNEKSGTRVYRRADVQMVLQIKELVYSEGLTLGAARRKLESAQEPASDAESLFAECLDKETRQQLAQVKQGLRDILGLLGEQGEGPTQAPLLKDTAPVAKTKSSVRVSGKTRKVAKPVVTKVGKTKRVTRARA